MKILYVGRDCKVGGGTTFRYRASRGMIERGHQVSLLSQPGPMVPRFRELGVRFHPAPPSPFNRLRLIPILRRERFDVVHAIKATEGDDVEFALRFVRPRPRFILSIHSVLPAYVTGNRCLREADQIIAFDLSAIARLRQIEFLQTREIHRVFRPVERREVSPPTTPPRVVVVGRLSKTKGQVALSSIEAVESLQGEFPGLSLTVVGGGTMLEEIKTRAESVNKQHKGKIIEVVGAAVDPWTHMNGAACVIGAAYVALEALFHEVPVVAAGFEAYGVVTPDNLQDAVDCNFGDGYPGLHKEPTPELFRAGLRQVLGATSTSAGREQYRHIRERLEERHSIESVAERLETIYTQSKK